MLLMIICLLCLLWNHCKCKKLSPPSIICKWDGKYRSKDHFNNQSIHSSFHLIKSHTIGFDFDFENDRERQIIENLYHLDNICDCLSKETLQGLSHLCQGYDAKWSHHIKQEKQQYDDYFSLIQQKPLLNKIFQSNLQFYDPTSTFSHGKSFTISFPIKPNETLLLLEYPVYRFLFLQRLSHKNQNINLFSKESQSLNQSRSDSSSDVSIIMQAFSQTKSKMERNHILTTRAYRIFNKFQMSYQSYRKVKIRLYDRFTDPKKLLYEEVVDVLTSGEQFLQSLITNISRTTTTITTTTAVAATAFTYVQDNGHRFYIYNHSQLVPIQFKSKSTIFRSGISPPGVNLYLSH